MGIIDKFKDLVGIEEYDEEVEEKAQEKPKNLERKSIDPRPSSAHKSEGKENKVIAMQNRTINPHTNAFKLMVIEPESFDECPKLVDSLKSRKPIIINLEKVDSDIARKVFDFLSGATYALNGNVQKVANNIFVFAPENVDISATSADQKSFEYTPNPQNNWGR